jgi:hypothetical protein
VNAEISGKKGDIAITIKPLLNHKFFDSLIPKSEVTVIQFSEGREERHYKEGKQ